MKGLNLGFWSSIVAFLLFTVSGSNAQHQFEKMTTIASLGESVEKVEKLRRIRFMRAICSGPAPTFKSFKFSPEQVADLFEK